MPEPSAIPPKPSTSSHSNVQNNPGVTAGQISGGITIGTMIVYAPLPHTSETSNSQASLSSISKDVGKNLTGG